MMKAPPPPFGTAPPPGTFGPGGGVDGGGGGGSFAAAEQMTGNVMRNRDLLYRLVISQLFYDGYQQVAVQLTNMLAVDRVCPPSDQLFHIVAAGLEAEAEKTSKASGGTLLPPMLPGVPEVVGPGLDLEFASDVEPSVPEPALYETAYVTSHKGNCRAGAFTQDGSLCATGSTDASIKILDVQRMLAKSNMDGAGKNSDHSHPVIRTLYDHVDVSCRLYSREREWLVGWLVESNCTDLGII